MKRFIIPVAFALLLAAGSEARADSLWKSMCKHPGTPTHLGELIQQSLNEDPSGNTPLDPVACHQERPASPNNFLAVLPQSDPDSGVTVVAQLPGYFHSLIPVEVSVKYWSSCMKPGGEYGWHSEANCTERYLHKTEVAWGNPRSRKPVLQGDCSNLMQYPPPPADCAYTYIWMTATTLGVKYAEYAPSPVEDEACGPAVMLPGSDEWESPWSERCPFIGCNFEQADRTLEPLGYTRQRQGTVGHSEQEGWLVFRHPLSSIKPGSHVGLNFCLKDSEKGQACGDTIVSEDYTNNIAVLGYDNSHRPKKDWKGTVRTWDFDISHCPPN